MRDALRKAHHNGMTASGADLPAHLANLAQLAEMIHDAYTLADETETAYRRALYEPQDGYGAEAGVDVETAADMLPQVQASAGALFDIWQRLETAAAPYLAAVPAPGHENSDDDDGPDRTERVVYHPGSPLGYGVEHFDAATGWLEVSWPDGAEMRFQTRAEAENWIDGVVAEREAAETPAPALIVGEVSDDGGETWRPMTPAERAEAEREAAADRESLRRQRANWNAVADGLGPIYPDEY